MINQEVKNITQSAGSTEQVITAEAGTINLTEPQMYFTIFGLFFFLSLIAILFYRIIKTVAVKSCLGCKRLLKCEKEIQYIKNKLNTTASRATSSEVKEIKDMLHILLDKVVK